MEKQMFCRIEQYIQAETNDAALYRALAEKAKCNKEKKLFLEFAADEQSHADKLSTVYQTLTGNCFRPRPEEPDVCGDMTAILKERVIDESGDARKYQRECRRSRCVPALSNIFADASTDENVHALRLLYMLS